MPRLWDETIEAHRRAVRDATLDTTAALVAEHGLASVTMSQIAAETGIGRATLYKYFPDVDAILVAWHERQVAEHLAQLAEVRDQAGRAGERLKAVLGTYALNSMSITAATWPHRYIEAPMSPKPTSNSGTLSGTCCARAQPAARSAMTSRQRSSPATASMLSPPLATCPPRLPSAGWSESSWLASRPGAGPEPPAPETQRGREWQNAAPSAGPPVGRSARSRTLHGADVCRLSGRPWPWWGPCPVMTRAEMRESLDLLPTWALEQKATANRQVIAIMRERLATGQAVARMYQEPGLAWLERQAQAGEALIIQRQTQGHQADP